MMEWSQSSQEHQDAVNWFKKFQLQAVIRNGLVPEWFHGIISRKTAEEQLTSKPPGYFLIRVSESRIGYTLSYRDEDRCRHFMIDALEDGHYVIVGDYRRHRSLQDLVDFHRRTPVMPFVQLLTVACGQSSHDKNDYAELLFPQRPPKSSLLPNTPPLSTTSLPVSQEDIPPALPYRPNNLMIATVQTNRLYPCLEDESQHVPSSPPAKPVPMNRKRYITDNIPSNQPPEVPARSCVPLKQNEACVRTVSVPETPPTSTASEHPPCTNVQPVKIQEAKPSVVTNLKNFKKMFHKKRSTSQDHTYAEVDVEGAHTENEYQELTGEQASGSPLPHIYTNTTQTDKALPQEYQPPPPFAPGY